MTVCIMETLTTYYPLWSHIPTFDVAEKVCDWQKPELPHKCLGILSNDVEMEGITRDFRDYDWTGII